MWGDASPAEIKTVWSAELAPYDGVDIGAALEQLRGTFTEYPPTLFQFANLCRDAKRARTASTPRLDYDPRGPIAPEIATVIAKAFDPTNRPHPRAWAQKILDRVEAGTEPRPPLYAIECAKEVVGMRT